MTRFFYHPFLLLCWVSVSVWGQQTPTFTEYNYNPFLVNPAYAGIQGDWEANLSNIGFGSADFDGAPKTFSFSAHSGIRDRNMGLGAAVINDKVGVTTATQVYGAYSYRIVLNDNAYPYWKVYDRSFISFGLQAGVLMYDQNLLSLGITDDPNFSGNINSTMPMAGAGVMFGMANFFAGISIPNLIGDSFSNQDNLKLSKPIYGYTGYHFVLDRYSPDYILKPSMLFKYESGAPFQVDVNLSLSIKSIIEIGAGYRTNSSFTAMAGFYIMKNIRALYNYTRNESGSPLGATHGIVLSYRAGKGFVRE